MKTLTVKTIGLAACLAAAGAWTAEAAESGWLTDFAKAKKQAAEQNKLILADFSGSDWCGWCIRLDREVFSQEAFRKFAADKLVLFLADFPRAKEQPDAVKTQNKRLASEYQIRGFPTVLLLDSEGQVKARTGYQRGGAEAYVQHLQELMKDAEKPEMD